MLLGSQFVQMASAPAHGSHRLPVDPGLAHSGVVLRDGARAILRRPCLQALIPTLIEREDLPNAIADIDQFNLARVIGPVIGGIA